MTGTGNNRIECKGGGKRGVFRVGRSACTGDPFGEVTGSMPVESEAFSSSARQGTTEDFALQLSASAVTGHLRLVMNVRFLTQDGPDREDGYSKEYRSGSEPEDEQSSLLM